MCLLLSVSVRFSLRSPFRQTPSDSPPNTQIRPETEAEHFREEDRAREGERTKDVSAREHENKLICNYRVEAEAQLCLVCAEM